MSIKKLSILAGALSLAVGSAFASTKIEAESYTAKDAGTVKEQYWMNYAYVSGSTGYLEWNNITVADAGEYKIVLHYANGNSATDIVKVKILTNDGSTVNSSNSDTKTLLYTGGWSIFKDVSFIIRLNSGTNKIRIAATTQEGPNLDYFTLFAAKTKVMEGTLDASGRAIYGSQADGIIDNTPVSQMRGYECFITNMYNPPYGTAQACQNDGTNEISHYYETPNSYWILHQPNSAGWSYSLEVKYWE